MFQVCVCVCVFELVVKPQTMKHLKHNQHLALKWSTQIPVRTLRGVYPHLLRAGNPGFQHVDLISCQPRAIKSCLCSVFPKVLDG